MDGREAGGVDNDTNDDDDDERVNEDDDTDDVCCRRVSDSPATRSRRLQLLSAAGALLDIEDFVLETTDDEKVAELPRFRLEEREV